MDFIHYAYFYAYDFNIIHAIYRNVYSQRILFPDTYSFYW